MVSLECRWNRCVRLRGIATAFTLIEMLVCMAIIAVLCALLLPAVQSAREGARRAGCRNHLFQTGVGLMNYHDAHRTFPPGYVSSVSEYGRDLGPGWGWGSLLLPFVEHGTIWRQIPFDAPPRSPASSTATRQRIEIFLCPSNLASAGSNYVANFGRGSIAAAPGSGDGVFFRNSRIRIKDIEDGGTTFLVGERVDERGGADWSGVIADVSGLGGTTPTVPSTNGPHRVLGHSGPPHANSKSHPKSSESDSDTANASGAVIAGTVVHVLNNRSKCPEDFSSHHSNGANFLFVDGTVRFVSGTVDASVYAALATRAGSEPISNTDF